MKRGMTLSIIIIAVTIMFIIISTSTVIGMRAVNAANYEEYMSNLSRVSDEVNSYLVTNKELPITSYEVISKEMFSEGLSLKLAENDDSMNNLYIVDNSKLNLTSVNIGVGDTFNKDVFLVAEDTGNIYYYKGFKYKNEWFYGI